MKKKMVELTLNNIIKLNDVMSNEKKLERFHLFFYQSFFTMLGISKIETIPPNDLEWLYMYYQIFVYDLLGLCGIEKDNLNNIFLENLRVTNEDCFKMYNNIIDFVKKNKNFE